jgi:hypothetical protein
VPGQRIENLVLESNVFIYSLDGKGRTNNARGTSADYRYTISNGETNEVAVLNGSPAVVVTPEGRMTSSRFVYDLVNGTIKSAPDYQGSYHAAGLDGSTNSPGLDLLKRPGSQ